MANRTSNRAARRLLGMNHWRSNTQLQSLGCQPGEWQVVFRKRHERGYREENTERQQKRALRKARGVTV